MAQQPGGSCGARQSEAPRGREGTAPGGGWDGDSADGGTEHPRHASSIRRACAPPSWSGHPRGSGPRAGAPPLHAPAPLRRPWPRLACAVLVAVGRRTAGRRRGGGPSYDLHTWPWRDSHAFLGSDHSARVALLERPPTQTPWPVQRTRSRPPRCRRPRARAPRDRHGPGQFGSPRCQPGAALASRTRWGGSDHAVALEQVGHESSDRAALAAAQRDVGEQRVPLELLDHGRDAIVSPDS